MVVKFKKLHEDAIEPTRAHPTDAGLDLYALAKGVYDVENNFLEYKTGIAFEIPEGYVGLIFPRSSISKTDFRLANSVGVVDSGYRGDVSFRFKVNGSSHWSEVHSRYEKGDRIGQLIIMPYPQVELEETEELSLSARNKGGYGSSGK